MNLTLKNELHQRINLYCRKEEYKEFLITHGLGKLFVKEISDISSIETVKNITREMELQKLKYNLLIQEACTILEEAKNRNISLLVMKGFILAHELYNPKEVRNFDDIDLLTKYEDLILADCLLKDLGYYTLNDEIYTNSLNCVINYPSIKNELTHLNVYHKCGLLEQGEQYNIEIDLHIRPFHCLDINKFNHENNLFSYARVLTINNCDFLTTGVQDTFIHLSAHFLRHYYWELFKFLRTGEDFVFRIDLLHEIALFIEKHQKEIVSEKTLDRVEYLNQIEPVVLTLYYIKNIYLNFDLEEFYNLLYKLYKVVKHNCEFSSRFVNCCLSLSVDMQLFSSNFLLAKLLLEQLNKDIPPQLFFKGSKNINFIKLKKVYFNKNAVSINENYVEENISNLMNSMNFECRSFFDDDFISIGISIEKCKILKFKQIGVSFCKTEDLSFANEFSKERDKKFYRNTFNLYCDSLSDIVHNSQFISSKQIKFETYLEKSSEEEYHVIIPWEIIGIKPMKFRKIGIEIFADYDMIVDSEVNVVRFMSVNECIYNYTSYYPWSTEYKQFEII